MTKALLETAVVYSNVCLKRWSRERSHLLTFENIRSLVNGWIIRAMRRDGQQIRWDPRLRSISKTLFITFDSKRHCITGITAEGLVIPVLNYDECNRLAQDQSYNVPSSVADINFNSIINIKFTSNGRTTT